MKNNTDMQGQIRDTIEQLVAPLLEHPEKFNIKLTPSQRKPIYTMTCDLSDYGVIIGKQGTMLQSLRYVTDRMAQQAGLEAELMLDEAGCSGQKRIRGQFTPNPEWTTDEMDKVAHLTLTQILGPVTIGWDTISTTSSKITIVAQMQDDTEQRLAEDALAQIFKSIGVRQGRIVKLEIVNQ
jgi:predicted RNA-binding protein YlqC (UPF0109 family)